MTLPSPWEHSLLVVRHHYYECKPSFEMEVDTYEQWAAFAVEDGKFVYAIGDGEGTAAAGQLVLCPPGIPFRRRTEQPITFHYFLFHWLDEKGRTLVSRAPRMGACIGFAGIERYRSTLSSLRSPVHAQHAAYRHWRSHALLDLLRLHALEQSLHAPPEAPAAVEPRIAEARRMLDGACDVPLSIGSVAEAVGLSAVQLTRRFRQAYGLTPSAYVESLRLDKVCHYLTHTALTIEQIALACGYSNGFYLSRVFAGKLRMPPSEYRNQHRI
jgi:AraC family transcriptional regulator